MARTPTFPDCFDEAKTITITCLRRLGYLIPGFFVRNASVHSTLGGRPCGSITLDVDAVNQFVELRYDVKRQYEDSARAIKYRVKLERRASNLGNGRIWYFICPATGKRCRTLYGIGDHFLSRFAYPSAMYSSQTKSKQRRELFRMFRLLDLESEFRRKPFARTIYNGKPTRRFARLLNNNAAAILTRSSGFCIFDLKAKLQPKK